MLVPLGWLRDYVTLPHDTRAIVDKLALLGFPVDAVHSRDPISGVVVGRITALEKHPNADRLQVCTLDVGTGTSLTIATAATNVETGQIVPVATIGAKLAGGLEIAPRTMRGIASEGMLCSAAELGLRAEWFEDGIMQLDSGMPLGTDVVERFRLNEDVLDVEVTSNRVDAMCMLGIARELAAGFGATVREPETSVGYGNVHIDESGNIQSGSFDSLDIKVSLQSDDVRRYVFQRISAVRVRTAKAWMRVRLALAGQRPINNLVDISNFVMLEVGQPLHFYDYDRLAGHHLIVRDATAGETMRTLDGTERTLSTKALLITDDAQIQGLAGLMGGAASEVTPATTELVIEAANFSGARVRRMSADVGLRSEASSRHEKALAIGVADLGAARSARLLEQEGAVIHIPRAIGRHAPMPTIVDLRKSQIPRLLGFALDNDTIIKSLTSLGFEATTMLTDELIAMLELSADDVDAVSSFEVTVPTWRTDIAIEADVVEEIARIVGYDKIVAEMPPIREQDIASTAYRSESRVAQTMARLGYHEVLTLALQPASVFARWRESGVDAHGAPVEIRNPLSEDQRFLRFSLVPGLLEVGRDRLFEIGTTFGDMGATRDIVEQTLCTFVRRTAAPQAQAWHDEQFVALKADTLALVRALTGREASVRRGAHAGWHPGICAELVVGDVAVAVVGALDPRLAVAFDIEDRVHVAQIDVSLVPPMPEAVAYVEPPKFPSLTRDIALVLDVATQASVVEASIARAAAPLARSVRAFDEYRGAQIGEGKKSLAVHVVLQRDDATMTDQEGEAAIARILEALRGEFGATIRS